MRIIVNGTPQDFQDKTTLEEVVIRFCRQPRYIVSAVNDTVIAPQNRKQEILQDSDRVELITPIGGG